MHKHQQRHYGGAYADTFPEIGQATKLPGTEDYAVELALPDYLGHFEALLNIDRRNDIQPSHLIVEQGKPHVNVGALWPKSAERVGPYLAGWMLVLGVKISVNLREYRGRYLVTARRDYVDELQAAINAHADVLEAAEAETEYPF